MLASWRLEEFFFRKKLKSAWRMKLGALGSIDMPFSYTKALDNKRILVVHLFAETIESQYRNNREKIFRCDAVLPQIASLETIKAVQSIAGNPVEYNTWFDALSWMENEIDKHDYDVCLIGCGAYGFPLAAHCKRMGKQAIHIGGNLQIYFGIKGKRWDGRNFYNEYWVRPSEEEKPKNLNRVEDGCYR